MSAELMARFLVRRGPPRGQLVARRRGLPLLDAVPEAALRGVRRRRHEDRAQPTRLRGRPQPRGDILSTRSGLLCE